MKKLRNLIKHKFSTRRYLKWFKFKHRPAQLAQTKEGE